MICILMNNRGFFKFVQDVNNPRFYEGAYARTQQDEVPLSEQSIACERVTYTRVQSPWNRDLMLYCDDPYPDDRVVREVIQQAMNIEERKRNKIHKEYMMLKFRASALGLDLSQLPNAPNEEISVALDMAEESGLQAALDWLQSGKKIKGYQAAWVVSDEKRRI